MKFEDLKKNLKINVKNNYLLTGDDVFLLDKAFELIFNSSNIEILDMNLIKFSSDSIDANNVVNALNTLPVFSTKKIVYMDLSNNNTKIINEKLFEKYFENINPTTIFIVKAGLRDDVLKQCINNFEIVDCTRLNPELAKKFMLNEISKCGKIISATTLNLLYDFTLGDLQKSINEIQKLVNFVGDRNEIIAEDIENIVTKSLEFQIYELTENLAQKNSQNAFSILKAMESKKDGSRGVLGLIYNHFRRLFHISLSNETKFELSKLLGIKEFAVTKCQSQCKYFNKKKLKQICDFCDDLDYKIKTSAIAPNLANELLLLYILQG